MRQYFNGNLTDSIISAITLTPTTVKTSLFTPAQANQCMPVGFGPSAPYAGQVYRFALGGVITTPATGTMVIDPYYGPGTTSTAFGVDMGASAAQTVTASLTNIAWRMTGELVFRIVSPTASSSTAFLTGMFASNGASGTAGSGWVVAFGSTASVTIDTTGTASAGLFGAINFAFTFSVTGATVNCHYTSMQALN